ncbi:hypothetical protein [Lentzea sp. NBRC 102530]|uniref:hypothetical protein n=1 Tax=Lentzea sp. NBRC 102530 TaxID=3032201 RepID=UPI0024A0F50E|nr:hypothetical protein [Lentzea sp. NBRC 102530]GLY46428.1 hypothetical protein Lesp01_00840 [Lentzea sp. NBRC 102530]
MKIFRHLASALGAFCALAALGAFAFAVVLTFVVSAFKDVEISAWNVVMSQVARWFLFWVGIYLVHNVLPIAVAHGRTRREFFLAASAFSVALAAVAALLGWLGFVAEGGIYALMDWQADEHGSPLAYVLMFLVWTAVGMFCAAAFDRYGSAGVFSVPVGFVLAIISTTHIPGAGRWPIVPNLPTAVGAGWHLLSLAAFVVALGLTWVIVRNAPVRVRS